MFEYCWVIFNFLHGNEIDHRKENSAQTFQNKKSIFSEFFMNCGCEKNTEIVSEKSMEMNFKLRPNTFIGIPIYVF